jgi:hypothetical protein
MPLRRDPLHHRTSIWSAPTTALQSAESAHVLGGGHAVKAAWMIEPRVSRSARLLQARSGVRHGGHVCAGRAKRSRLRRRRPGCTLPVSDKGRRASAGAYAQRAGNLDRPRRRRAHWTNAIAASPKRPSRLPRGEAKRSSATCAVSAASEGSWRAPRDAFRGSKAGVRRGAPDAPTPGQVQLWRREWCSPLIAPC